MLRDIDATAMIAVKDVASARSFYEGTLSLVPTDAEQEGMVSYQSGKTSFVVYESQFAGTNQANALAWVVGDQFDSIVEDLRAKGVTFERYDLPGLTLEGDVHVAEGFKGAWFKDPDGNICTSTGDSSPPAHPSLAKERSSVATRPVKKRTDVGPFPLSLTIVGGPSA